MNFSIKKLRRLGALKRPIKILVVQNGDLINFILTLPLIASIKKQLFNSQVYVLVHRSIEPLVPLLPQIDGSIGDVGVVLKHQRLHFKASERTMLYNELVDIIRVHSFDLAVVVYNSRENSSLIYSSKIPYRAGVKQSYFFGRYNLKNVNNQSFYKKNEAQFNLSFLRTIGLRPVSEIPEVLQVHPPSKKKLTILYPFNKKEIKGGGLAKVLRFYAQANPKQKFIIMGEPNDDEVLQKNFADLSNCEIRTSMTLRQSAELLASCDFFIGVVSKYLHLAALMQTPYIGFFSKEQKTQVLYQKPLPVPGAPDDVSTYLIEYAASTINQQLTRDPSLWLKKITNAKRNLKKALASYQEQINPQVKASDSLFEKISQDIEKAISEFKAPHKKQLPTPQAKKKKKKNRAN